MIKAKIQEVVTNKITDWLGGDEVERGEERTGVYPCVSVVYYDDQTNEQYGIATYPLRPRSAIETVEDVRLLAAQRIAELENEQPEPAPVDRKVPRSTQTQVDDLQTLVGEEL